MKLICEKYNEQMESEAAECRHPGEYCKFRTACIIHFMSDEKDLDIKDNDTVSQEEIANKDR